jgi:tRNA A-37 threonylcarbamoyl transferase component Bud32
MEKLNNYMAECGLFNLDVLVQQLIAENQPLTKVFGSGIHGKVYEIDDNYVIKVGKRIDKEYRIAKELYEAGIPVPKPIGVFDVEVEHSYGKVRVEKGFVMELVRNDMCRLEKEDKLRRRYKLELKKCRKLGFIPRDYYWPECFGGKRHNILYNEKQDKIYLIDFGAWRKKER